MTEQTVGTVTIQLLQGDITRQPDMDGVVNAANAQLQTGGGVAGAIHRAAGPGLAEECAPLAPIAPGEAVITGAHQLPNRYVIHCLGPVYGQDKPEAELLASCYRRALALAEEHGLTSIAFPAISTGVFGYPMAEAARVALSTVMEAAPALDSVHTIRFVLYDEASRDIHIRVLRQLTDEGTDG